MGTLTKGAHYFAFHCCKILLSTATDQRKPPTIKAWFNKIRVVYDSRQNCHHGLKHVYTPNDNSYFFLRILDVLLTFYR